MRSGSLIVIVCLTSLTSFTVTSSFYPRYMPILTNLSQNVCNETLALMQGVTYTPDSAPSAADFCYGRENCMLANVPAAYLSNYQAASVIMGLTPTLLASLGPSVAETSLLSAHRPLLSFLISLGAPVVYPMRVFDFTDPFSLLQHKQHMFKPPLLGGKSSVLCSILEYAFSLAAAVSIISTSVQLGAKTVLVWACTNKAMPLVWTFMSVAIHAMAALGYRIALNSSNRQLSRDHPCKFPEGLTKSSRKRDLGHMWTKLQSEFGICAHRQQLLVHRLDDANLTCWRVFLTCSAGLAGFFHVVFGTLIFSSLTFISVFDFLNYVFWRYIAAATVCRIILMVELTGLRAVERKSEQQSGEGINYQSL